jgi:hypothetical protein
VPGLRCTLKQARSSLMQRAATCARLFSQV